MFSRTIGQPGPVTRAAVSLQFRLVWFRHSLLPSLAKHAFDVILSVLVIPLALVLMAVIALVILVDSGRPVLFVQERIGRGGRRFRMFKFRTLRKDYADTNDRKVMKDYIEGHTNGSHGAKPAIHKPFEACHTTPVGRILRKTSLDELPQILNVLRGEMSLVGPRPHVPWEVEVYRGWHTERLEVLPGITGLSQVRGRSGLTFDSMARYDIEYVRKKSLWLDLKILWWTIECVFSGRGAG
ncbi:MAG: sugar transferase [Chloroflexi bacterium]|nr:sugar transferase [Chloroflexota bacterium]